VRCGIAGRRQASTNWRPSAERSVPTGQYPRTFKEAIVSAIMATFNAEATGPGMLISIVSVMAAADMADIKRTIAEMPAAARAEIRKIQRAARLPR
jgi:hypothetical protein